jgi:hypothetical protein
MSSSGSDITGSEAAAQGVVPQMDELADPSFGRDHQLSADKYVGDGGFVGGSGLSANQCPLITGDGVIRAAIADRLIEAQDATGFADLCIRLQAEDLLAFDAFVRCG